MKNQIKGDGTNYEQADMQTKQFDIPLKGHAIDANACVTVHSSTALYFHLASIGPVAVPFSRPSADFFSRNPFPHFFGKGFSKENQNYGNFRLPCDFSGVKRRGLQEFL